MLKRVLIISTKKTFVLSVVITLLTVFIDKFSEIENFGFGIGLPFNFYFYMNSEMPKSFFEIVASSTFSTISFRVDLFFLNVLLYYFIIRIINKIILRYRNNSSSI